MTGSTAHSAGMRPKIKETDMTWLNLDHACSLPWVDSTNDLYNAMGRPQQYRMANGAMQLLLLLHQEHEDLSSVLHFDLRSPIRNGFVHMVHGNTVSRCHAVFNRSRLRRFR